MRDRRFAIAAFVVFMALFVGIYLYSQRGPAGTAASSNQSADINNVDGTSSAGSNSTESTIDPAKTGVTVQQQFKGKSSEWNAAFGNIIAFQNQLLQKPDPSKVAQIIDPSCTCYEDTRAALQTMKEKGHRVNGKTMELRASALLKQEGDSYVIAATFAGGGAPTVDRNGKTVTPGNTDQSQPIRYTLKKKSNGGWVITDRRNFKEATK